MLKYEQKEYCANNISAMIITALRKKHPKEGYKNIIFNFINSNTYELLYDFETGFWAEGPGYVLNEYLIEQKQKI